MSSGREVVSVIIDNVVLVAASCILSRLDLRIPSQSPLVDLYLSAAVHNYGDVCGSAIGGSARRPNADGSGNPLRVWATPQYPQCRPTALRPGAIGLERRSL